MKVEYDPQADAIYIRLKHEPIATTREIDDNLVVDVDASGKIVGIEILFVSEYLTADDIESLTVQRLAS